MRKHGPLFLSWLELMAFTASDRTSVEQAMVRFATDGIATAVVAGQQVTARSMADLEILLKQIDRDLEKSAAGSRSDFGIRRFGVTGYYP